MTEQVGTVEQGATPYNIEVKVDKTQLEAAFSRYWNAVKDRLSQDLIKKATRGGYREIKRDKAVKAAGGKALFFRPVLIEFVDDFLSKQDRQAIVFNELQLIDGIAVDTIVGSVYMEPEVKWKTQPPGIDTPFAVKLRKLPTGLVERVVQQELERACEDNVILVPVSADVKVADGNAVAIDCRTLVDGQPWEPGCVTNAKWRVADGVFKLPEIYNALIGMTAGESKELEFKFNDKFDSMTGKTASATIKVHQVYVEQKPDIDDDLAISVGRRDLESWKAELTAKYEKVIAEERQNAILANVLGQLINVDVVDVSPVPQVWMRSKALSTYESNRNMHHTEEDLLSAFSSATTADGSSVTTKQDLLKFFAEQSAQQLVYDLVVRAWGKMKGIEGNTNLSNLSKYVDSVREAMVQNISVEEVENESAAK